MSDDKQVKVSKTRRNLVIATCAASGVAGVGAAVPFAASWLPSERAKAAGAPVEADIDKLEPGDKMTVEWRGQPVWIVRRDKAMQETIVKNKDKLADPNSERNADDLTPQYARNELRSIKPEFLVVVGICSHLGCSPSDKFKIGQEPFDPNWEGGFYCPCHGSLFDLAGRVYKNKPAPDNLKVPPHIYLSDTRILIGDDKKGA